MPLVKRQPLPRLFELTTSDEEKVWNLSEKGFLIKVLSTYEGYQCFVKYDSLQNTWTRFKLDISDPWKYPVDSIEYDCPTDSLYVLSNTEKNYILSIYDGQTGALLHRQPVVGGLQAIGDANNMLMKRVAVKDEWGEIAEMILLRKAIKGLILLVYQWDIKFISDQIPIGYPEAPPNGKLIQVPSKNVVLMFSDGQTRKNSFGKWKKWELIRGLEFKMDFSLVLTSDEDFVIIAEESNVHLKVLDIRNERKYILRESAVKVPRRLIGGLLARTGGKATSRAIVSGWIRKLSKSAAFRTVDIPLVIIDMIKSWYLFEMIHYINKRTHLVFPLTDILYSEL